MGLFLLFATGTVALIVGIPSLYWFSFKRKLSRVLRRYDFTRTSNVSPWIHDLGISKFTVESHFVNTKNIEVVIFNFETGDGPSEAFAIAFPLEVEDFVIHKVFKRWPWSALHSPGKLMRYLELNFKDGKLVKNVPSKVAMRLTADTSNWPMDSIFSKANMIFMFGYAPGVFDAISLSESIMECDVAKGMYP